MSREIDVSKKEWDYSSLVFGDLDKQILKEKKVVEEKVSGFVSKWKGRSDYLESSNVLKEVLDELEDLMTNYGTSWNVGQYLWLRKKKNQTDEEIKAKFELVNQLDKTMSNSLIFFELSLLKIDKEKRKEFLENSDLITYKHYLERVFRRADFMLSEDVEKVLNLKSGPSYSSWIDMLSELLSKEERKVFTGEKDEVKNFSEILGLLSSSDSKVRDSCADAFNDILKNKVDVAVAEINAIFKNKKIDDELRGYSRPDEARIISDDIDFEFVDSLLEVVSSRYDISRKFYELKAKLFGKEKLKYHERVVPYGEISREIRYDEAVKIVHRTFSKIDGEFGEIFKELVEDGNIDVYPAMGKQQGASCSWGLKIHPTRILLNYMDRIRDVTTLAHEAGHAINHELMKKQSSFDFGVPMAIAEVSSNFAEGVVFEDLLSRIENDEERLAMMISKIGDDLSSVSRQVACYKFEKELHEKFRREGNLSSETIGKIFHENMKAYMGDFVEHPESSYNWWVYWWHIRDYFYVYSYASGTLIANAMVKKYKDDPKFISKIKKFLSLGSSKSPRDAFSSLGIELDERFWNDGLNNIEEMLDKTWRLAEKLGKI